MTIMAAKYDSPCHVAYADESGEQLHNKQGERIGPSAGWWWGLGSGRPSFGSWRRNWACRSGSSGSVGVETFPNCMLPWMYWL